MEVQDKHVNGSSMPEVTASLLDLAHFSQLDNPAESGKIATRLLLLAERVYELEMMAYRSMLKDIEILEAELLGTVSHKLRSPLASIKGYAATLLRHEHRISDEERHEFLLAITEASDRLERVINCLLEISQLETGVITIDKKSVDLMYLVREAIVAQEQRYEGLSDTQRRLTFRVCTKDLSSDEGLVVQADRQRLREVLDNLLENAINYSPEGGTIEIVIRPVLAKNHADKAQIASNHDRVEEKPQALPSPSPDQQMVEIGVHDNGRGIPSSQLELIFDRFHRVDARLTRDVDGLGLGLTICKRIVELHGGMIWAESEFGQGSTFRVWLPIEAKK